LCVGADGRRAQGTEAASRAGKPPLTGRDDLGGGMAAALVGPIIQGLAMPCRQLLISPFVSVGLAPQAARIMAFRDNGVYVGIRLAPAAAAPIAHFAGGLIR